MIASFPNRNPLRGMGVVRVCIAIALIFVTGVGAVVVDNQMTDEQFDHSELMEETELTNPEFGMKVFVYYEDKKNPRHLSPAVITGVNTMLDSSVEINVRYLDGSMFNNRAPLEDVFFRDNTVSYANWVMDGYDPRTMDANGQPRVISGSNSRPFVSRPSTGAAFHGGGYTRSSSSGAAMGSSSGGGGGGAAKLGGAAKKRKTTGAKTGKEAMTGAKTDKQPMGHYMDDALYGEMDLETAIAELKQDGVWMLEKTLELNKVKAQNAKLRAERDAAVARACQSDLRAAAAEARAAVLQQQMETAEADSARAERATRTPACRDFQGTGSGK